MHTWHMSVFAILLFFFSLIKVTTFWRYQITEYLTNHNNRMVVDLKLSLQVVSPCEFLEQHFNFYPNTQKIVDSGRHHCYYLNIGYLRQKKKRHVH